MVDLLLVVMLHGGGGVKERGHQVCLDVCDLDRGTLHTVNDVLQVEAVQFEESLSDHLVRISLAAYAYGAVPHAHGLADQFVQFFVKFPVWAAVIAHVSIILDVMPDLLQISTLSPSIPSISED